MAGFFPSIRYGHLFNLSFIFIKKKFRSFFRFCYVDHFLKYQIHFLNLCLFYIDHRIIPIMPHAYVLNSCTLKLSSTDGIGCRSTYLYFFGMSKIICSRDLWLSTCTCTYTLVMNNEAWLEWLGWHRFGMPLAYNVSHSLVHLWLEWLGWHRFGMPLACNVSHGLVHL